MIENGYEKNIDVKYSEMDFDKGLKPYSLLNYFQDVASENAEEWGFGYSYITPKNLMWVLLKYSIEFEEYPVDIYKLKVKTAPRGYNKLFAYRDFELYSGEKLLGRAASMWSLVDFTNMTLANPDEALNNPYMVKHETKDDDLKFGKISNIEKVDIEKEFEVRYNDLDVNHHANNGNYIVWALEPLDYDFKVKHKPKIIDMIFKKEAKFKDRILSQVQFIDEQTTVHAIKNAVTGEDLCLFQCHWN